MSNDIIKQVNYSIDENSTVIERPEVCYHVKKTISIYSDDLFHLGIPM